MADGESAHDMFVSRYSEGPVMTHEVSQWLDTMGFTPGLKIMLIKNAHRLPMRFFIVDNSGSMMERDGSRIVGDRLRECSRWMELRQCVLFHGELSHKIGAPASFRLLSAPQEGAQFVSTGSRLSEILPAAEGGGGLDGLKLTMCTQPRGGTPLTARVCEVRDLIVSNMELMRSRSVNHNAVLVIMTDGLPTEQGVASMDEARRNFEAAIKSLDGLPIQVVVRLCTNDESVVDFYNRLDGQVEIALDVLDDIVGEAEEVMKVQPWLNYGLPLHYVREFGVANPIFDILDERPLTVDEMVIFLREILDEDLPDADDFNQFASAVRTRVESMPMVFNPVKRRMQPWINVSALTSTYSDGGCTIS